MKEKDQERSIWKELLAVDRIYRYSGGSSLFADHICRTKDTGQWTFYGTDTAAWRQFDRR